MAAAMAATNSFLYAGLSPAAAALLPRLYAANSFLAASSGASCQPPQQPAGLLATVPQLPNVASRSASAGQQLVLPGGPMAPVVGAPPMNDPSSAANFMLAADPALWAALAGGGGGGFGGPVFGAHPPLPPPPPPGNSGGLLGQAAAQLMVQQQQHHHHHGGRNTSSSTPM